MGRSATTTTAQKKRWWENERVTVAKQNQHRSLAQNQSTVNLVTTAAPTGIASKCTNGNVCVVCDSCCIPRLWIIFVRPLALDATRWTHAESLYGFSQSTTQSHSVPTGATKDPKISHSNLYLFHIGFILGPEREEWRKKMKQFFVCMLLFRWHLLGFYGHLRMFDIRILWNECFSLLFSKCNHFVAIFPDPRAEAQKADRWIHSPKTESHMKYYFIIGVWHSFFLRLSYHVFSGIERTRETILDRALQERKTNSYISHLLILEHF